jgi:hypothetical protein
LHDLEPDPVLGVQHGSPEAARCRCGDRTRHPVRRTGTIGQPTSKVVLYMSMSVDGSITGPDDGHDHGPRAGGGLATTGLGIASILIPNG